MMKDLLTGLMKVFSTNYLTPLFYKYFNFVMDTQ